MVILPVLFFMMLWGPVMAAPDSAEVPVRHDVLNLGAGFGGAYLGLDVEFRLSDKLGVKLGGGIVGAAAGLNYHVVSDAGKDLYVSFDGKYQGMLAMLIPGVNVGFRKYFGKARTRGLCLELGLMVLPMDMTLGTGDDAQEFKRGSLGLNIAVGTAFKQ